MIHAFDYPPLAKEALPAARAYAKIAPASPHALHMPSHIFTRLGLWQESIASNLASADAARRLAAERHPGTVAFDALHALDYLEYAYLQIGDDAHARGVSRRGRGGEKFDEAAVRRGLRARRDPRPLDARAARLEGRRGARACRGELPGSGSRTRPRSTYFAQAIGAARSGQPDRARAALGRLEEIQAGLRSRRLPALRLGERGRVHAAGGGGLARVRRGEEGRGCRCSPARAPTSRTRPASIPSRRAPLPARELLGDMLLERGEPPRRSPSTASLREAPDRFNSLYGAARAAELAKDPQAARKYWEELLAQSVAGSNRPEIAEARRALRQPPRRSRRLAGLEPQRGERRVDPFEVEGVGIEVRIEAVGSGGRGLRRAAPAVEQLDVRVRTAAARPAGTRARRQGRSDSGCRDFPAARPRCGSSASSDVSSW